MSQKSLILIGMSVGSMIGGYIPTFFGADIFSLWSLLTTAIGGFLGIYIVYKLS